MMHCTALLLASCLTVVPAPQAGAKPTDEAPESAVADRLTLREGGVVRGLVTAAEAGPRGGVEMLVRRAWAQANLPSRFKIWDRNAQAAVRPALAQRRARLKSWRRERATNATKGDPIVAWIDRELDRLNDPKTGTDAPLMAVRIARSDVRELVRRPSGSGNGRLLALGWRIGLKDVETMSADDARIALEGRGLDLDGDEIPPLDSILPIAAEPEERWLARRAATELAVDPNLRFLRYQGLLLPDTKFDQAPALGGVGGLGGLDATSALGELVRMLDPTAAAADPLPPALEKIAATGRAGAAVTSLEIAPDMSQVSVESTLWIRGPRGWVVWGSRNATVRPEDVEDGVEQQVAADPQVQTAFDVLEKLGLGASAGDLKRRALKIGAATSKALGVVRGAFNQELDALAMPVLDQPSDATPVPEAGKPEAPRSDPNPGP